MNLPKNRKNIFCFVLILGFIVPGVNAKNVLKYISNINGLSNNAVNCIFEDSGNSMWFGTWDGLNEYNGRDIKTYRYNRTNPHSISNNIIRQILEQKGECLWIATDYGINKWDKKKQSFTRYYLGTEDEVPKQEHSFVLGMTSDGHVMALVKGKGFFYYRKDTDAFERMNMELESYAKDFKIDRNDYLYILFQDGDVAYMKVGQKPVTLAKESWNYIRVTKPVEKIFLDGGYLFLNTRNELTVIADDFSVVDTIRGEPQKNISQVICMDRQVYFSFYEGGCTKYDLDKKVYSVVEKTLEKTSIFTLYKGSQDILWIGSDGQGVLQLYKYNSPFAVVYTNYAVRCFCENDQGDILVGTKGGGIKLLDKSTGRLNDFLEMSSGLISNSIYAIVKNSSGDIFIGTEGAGINVLRAGSHKLEMLNIPSRYPYFKAVYNICFTNNDSLLWVGTSGYGLLKMRLDKQNNRYTVNDVVQFISTDQVRYLNNDIVYATAFDSPNTLWFGTRGGGINKMDISENKIERFEDLGSGTSLTNNDVLSLLDDGEKLWIGTSYGLNKLVKGKGYVKLEQFAENNVFNNNTIHGILKDEEGNIWISTSQGLSLIEKDKEIRNFTFKDGLQNDEFSDGAYYKDSANILYFGGVSGFNYFNPATIHFRKFDAPCLLSELRIFNTSQNIDERIKNNTLQLSYDERYVAFSFVAKDFINNENCEYAYRLLNYSDDWILQGNNPGIIFSNLLPGNYTLEVKSTNGDKHWSNSVYRLSIHVSYPWWLSKIAVICYVLLILVVIYIAQSVIRNRIRLNRQILIKQIESQHQQKMYESKLNFFTNVAHEFFTPLTLIYGGAQHLLDVAGTEPHTKKYLQIIKSNAERMQKLISELMEFRKAKTGFTPLHTEYIDVKLLTEYISDNYVEVLQENKIDFRIETRDLSRLFTDRDSLEKIFFNLFSNAFKYTPGNGYIHIKVWQEGPDDTLHLVVRNSGKGLTEHQMTEIFNKYKIFDTPPQVGNAVSTGIGLNLTKSLVELLGGEINVSSQLGEYVEFSLVIPPLHPDTINIVADDKEVAVASNELTFAKKESKDVTILIIDDEKNIRELLKDILSPAYNIKEASDGKEALAIIGRNHPDIIITDILMPNMDGISLINALKSDSKTGYIPVIGVSAKSAIEDYVDAYKHGADMYIAKPFHPKYVVSAIENLLSKQVLLKQYYNSGMSAVKVKNGTEIHEEDEKLIRDIMDFIHQNIDDETLNPHSIAEFLNISKASLYRKLKEITGQPPSEFVRSIRLEYAAKLLIKTRLTVSEIMFKSGFSNKSYFYREFLKVYGASPKDYRNQSLSATSTHSSSV